jgi:hypothetical protein
MPQASPKTRKKQKSTLSRSVSKVSTRTRTVTRWLTSKMNRGSFAYILMVSFILCTSIGAGMVYPPAGWVVAGVASGIFGFLLGLE